MRCFNGKTGRCREPTVAGVRQALAAPRVASGHHVRFVNVLGPAPPWVGWTSVVGGSKQLVIHRDGNWSDLDMQYYSERRSWSMTCCRLVVLAHARRGRRARFVHARGRVQRRSRCRTAFNHLWKDGSWAFGAKMASTRLMGAVLTTTRTNNLSTNQFRSSWKCWPSPPVVDPTKRATEPTLTGAADDIAAEARSRPPTTRTTPPTADSPAEETPVEVNPAEQMPGRVKPRTMSLRPCGTSTPSAAVASRHASDHLPDWFQIGDGRRRVRPVPVCGIAGARGRCHRRGRGVPQRLRPERQPDRPHARDDNCVYARTAWNTCRSRTPQAGRVGRGARQLGSSARRICYVSVLVEAGVIVDQSGDLPVLM